MDLMEVGYDDKDRINLAQDRNRWRAFVHEESIRCAQSLNIVPEDAFFQKNEHFLNATKIRNLLRNREFDIWFRHPQKGKGVVLFKQYPGVNKLICKHEGLSNSEWCDGIKMVGNVAAVRAVPERPQDNRCRHCHNKVETLAHILGSCPHGEALRNTRHHQVRSIIATALKDADYNTFEEIHDLSVTGSTRHSGDEDCKDSDRAQLQATAEFVTELPYIVQPYNEEGGTDIRKDSDLISNEIDNSPPPTRRIKRERNKVKFVPEAKIARDGSGL
ncbi:hypothetical protein ANN_03948 [Periplaneta americana]|uniref:Reverse transcriptase n=1 Tax=Periplaneta americana TaxID=6978 RepID=A0ABQ8T784_PERAM|nr:hypothetical protein ANN_03948 [Periplaneta americana]